MFFQTLFVSFTILSVLGVICFIAAILYSPVEKLRIKSFTKLAILVATYFCALGGMFTGAQGKWPDGTIFSAQWLWEFWTEPWNRPVVASGAALLLWQAVQIVLESRMEKRLRWAGATERQTWLQLGLIIAVRHLVNMRIVAIDRSLGDTAPEKASISLVRHSLAPKNHAGEVVRLLAQVLHKLHPEHGSKAAEQQNFRVGLYVNRNGSLEPLISFEEKTQGYEPFSSYRKYPGRFCLANEINPSNAVRCIQKRQMIIVSDCRTHFNAAQAEYLKSMVAWPILDYRLSDGTKTQAALVVDTNVSGFFLEEDRETIECFLCEFAARLNFEGRLLALLGIRQET